MKSKNTKVIILFLMLVLVSFSSSKLLANTSVYINQANTSGGVINLNRNEDLIFPTSLTGLSPSNVTYIHGSPGVTWQYEYESAINSSAYRVIFPGTGYFSINFQYSSGNGSGYLPTASYSVFVAP